MTFLTQAIYQPKYVGAIAPSSDKLATLITDKADLELAKVVVELGPGTGAFTKEILKKINPQTKCLAIEINKHFVEIIKQKYPAINVCHDSAINIQDCLQNLGQQYCDRIISGLPWTAFALKKQEDLLTNISESLCPNGLFLTFAYFPLNHLRRGRLFKERLFYYFREVAQTKIVANFPPALVYICKK